MGLLSDTGVVFGIHAFQGTVVMWQNQGFKEIMVWAVM